MNIMHKLTLHDAEIVHDLFKKYGISQATFATLSKSPPETQSPLASPSPQHRRMAWKQVVQRKPQEKKHELFPAVGVTEDFQ